MTETKLFELVTGNEMKPWLSRNLLPNINTCKNGRSTFWANLRVLKLLELTQFAWPNLSIYFNFLCTVPRDDVIESTRFLMRPPVIIPPWCWRSESSWLLTYLASHWTQYLHKLTTYVYKFYGYESLIVGLSHKWSYIWSYIHIGHLQIN